MNHETVVPLLSDFVSGRLDAAVAAEVQAHLAACSECGEVASTLDVVRREAAAHGAPLFDEHPSSGALAEYAFADDRLDTRELARIGEHARSCPTCRHEVEVTRRTHADSAAWWRAAIRGLFAPRAPAPWGGLGPALAAITLVLAYPAYLGLVQVPALRDAQRRTLAEISTLRERETQLRATLESVESRLQDLASWGGGVSLLFLPASQRGGGAEIPEIRLHPGQPFQPILIDYDLGDPDEWPPSAAIAFVVRRLPKGTEVWRHETTVEAAWDPASEGVSLLAPAGALVSGEYRLEFRRAGAAEPDYLARFRVRGEAAR